MPPALLTAGTRRIQNYKFHHDKDGNYFLDLNLEKGTYEFKITRGGWDNVECKQDGESNSNRFLKVAGKDECGIGDRRMGRSFSCGF